MRNFSCSILLLILPFLVSCTKIQKTEFEVLNNSSDWNLQLDDPCTENWENNWFLDGLIARVEQSEKGMNLVAGPINRDDAHHTVLWTKQSFKGDIKIEYNYTRTDGQLVNVNILYIQASGIGKDGFDVDISKWNKFREVPAMSKYFNYMNALHISYAAFDMVNDDPDADYVRIRKYPATEEIPFENTEIPPAYFNTGLFIPGETYKITVIKTGSKLFMNVKGKEVEKLFSWDLPAENPITEGRIGLRHMYTRSAMYSDFKVFVN
jgi:hypothetical protein